MEMFLAAHWARTVFDIVVGILGLVLGSMINHPLVSLGILLLAGVVIWLGGGSARVEPDQEELNKH